MRRFNSAGFLTGGLLVAMLGFGCGEEETRFRELYAANLRGIFAVPPVTSPGTGTAYISFDDHTDIATAPHLHYKVEARGLTAVTSGALTLGAAGQPGTVFIELFHFDPPVDTTVNRVSFSGTVTLEPNSVVNGVPVAQFLDQLRAGELAVTVVTVNHPQGELRGQFEFQ